MYSIDTCIVELFYPSPSPKVKDRDGTTIQIIKVPKQLYKHLESPENTLIIPSYMKGEIK
jgi:hypothetical protein